MSRYVEPTEQLVVEVFVRDAERAKRFYRDLGFELFYESKGFVSLTWEGHRLFLDERPSLPVVPPGLLPNVRIMVSDVDAHWRRVQELGATILTPIGDREYGLRDFTIADPDGFGLRFATRLADNKGG